MICCTHSFNYQSFTIPRSASIFSLPTLPEVSQMITTAPTITKPNLSIIDAYYIEHINSCSFAPAVYFIEPTNACNLACIMCPNPRLSDHSSYMNFHLFSHLIDQIRESAIIIRLNYRGEPLLHPEIVAMIRHAKERTTARISLSTNATLLTPSLSQELINSGLDEIVFSVDANTPATYNKIKGRDLFQQTIDNIHEFLQVSRESNIKIILKIIEMHANETEIDHFLRRWQSFRCHVKISWMSTWANQLPANRMLSPNLCPAPSGRRVACADLWYKMAITSDGLIPICCHDYLIKYPIGNLNNSTIADIWNNSHLTKLRAEHHHTHFSINNLCKLCPEFSARQNILEYMNVQDFPLGRP